MSSKKKVYKVRKDIDVDIGTDLSSFNHFAKHVNDEINVDNNKNKTDMIAKQLGHKFDEIHQGRTQFFGTYTNKMCVMFIPNFLDETYANDLFDTLKNIKYNSDEDSMIKIMGKQMKIPRKQIAFGDPNANYHFSGTSVKASDWYNDNNCINSRAGRELMVIASRIGRLTGTEYNYVLVNNYVDQTNSIGYHSDDEKELGKYPTIAGISLGQERDIYFKSNETDEIVKISLPHNSLYVMIHPTNQNWKHSIPKKAKRLGQRISLTYRCIEY
jgi:alkylated DNA repair dioxygenase AlkB